MNDDGMRGWRLAAVAALAPVNDTRYTESPAVHFVAQLKSMLGAKPDANAASLAISFVDSDHRLSLEAGALLRARGPESSQSISGRLSAPRSRPGLPPYWHLMTDN